jgi:hypothetical protein
MGIFTLRSELPGLVGDVAGDEGRLHLLDRVIDGHAGTFVQDLDAEDLHRGRRAHFVGAAEGDVEGQDLIGVPGLGLFLETGDEGVLDAGEAVDGGAGRDPDVAGEVLVEDRILRDEGVLVGLELGSLW